MAGQGIAIDENVGAEKCSAPTQNDDGHSSIMLQIYLFHQSKIATTEIQKHQKNHIPQTV